MKTLCRYMCVIKINIVLDINPQCLMIHVKKSEEILPEIKQRKGKRKANENIMPSLAHNNSQNEGGEENEEEGINVFQSNKGIKIKVSNFVW